jgi:hypothetical protein
MRIGFNTSDLTQRSGLVTRIVSDHGRSCQKILLYCKEYNQPTTEWCENSIGEQVTAVSFLLDRISPHRPSVDYENRVRMSDYFLQAI